MTNREYLNNLSNEEFMNAIQKICKTVAFDYVDWIKWLDAPEGDEIEYIGEKGQICKITFEDGQVVLTDEWEDCIVLADTTMFGKPYKVILEKGHYCKAPAEQVRLCNATD